MHETLCVHTIGVGVLSCLERGKGFKTPVRTSVQKIGHYTSPPQDNQVPAGIFRAGSEKKTSGPVVRNYLFIARNFKKLDAFA